MCEYSLLRALSRTLSRAYGVGIAALGFCLLFPTYIILYWNYAISLLYIVIRFLPTSCWHVLYTRMRWLLFLHVVFCGILFCVFLLCIVHVFFGVEHFVLCLSPQFCILPYLPCMHADFTTCRTAPASLLIHYIIFLLFVYCIIKFVVSVDFGDALLYRIVLYILLPYVPFVMVMALPPFHYHSYCIFFHLLCGRRIFWRCCVPCGFCFGFALRF